MNSIGELLKRPFLTRCSDEQLKIKELGRPLRILEGGMFDSDFDPEIYAKHDWLCGCETKQALFCFPCALFNGEEVWSSTGYTDFVNLSINSVRHELSSSHIHNVINLAAIGKSSAKNESLNEKKKAIQQHNIQVGKNLQVLDLLIDTIKFCAQSYIPIIKKKFEEDEDDFYVTDDDAFYELLELVSGPNNTLKNYLKMDIFKNDMESMKIDIVESALQVYHEEIIKEIHKSKFVSLIVEELGDCAKFQKVMILRYVVDSKPVERIWKLLKEEDSNMLFETLKQELGVIIDDTSKLISQSYKELNLKQCGPTFNIHSKIRTIYPNAQLVHFYRHHLHDIITNTIDFNVEVRVFFGYICSIANFFTKELWSKRPREVFERIISEKPKKDRKNYDFESDIFNTVYNYKDEILDTMFALQEDPSITYDLILSKAYSFSLTLEEEEFEYWLEIFHKIIPLMEYHLAEYENCLKPLDPDSSFMLSEEDLNKYLSGEEQVPSFNPTLVKVKVEEDLEIFQTDIATMKMEVDDISQKEEPVVPSTSTLSRKRKYNDGKKELEMEVINCILLQLQERLKFRGHTFAGRLVDPRNFRQYSSEFPESFMDITLQCYPALSPVRLRPELEVLYDRLEYQALTSVCSLMAEISKDELKKTFKETMKLVSIVLTIPAKTNEEDRCFATLDEIDFSLERSKDEDYLLHSLIVLACEKEFVENIYEFNEKVVKIFSEKPKRAEHFKRQTSLF